MFLIIKNDLISILQHSTPCYMCAFHSYTAEAVSLSKLSWVSMLQYSQN